MLFDDIPVRWQSAYYHITMAFLNDATAEQMHIAKEIIGRRLYDVQPMTMTFDKIAAFPASSGGKHIIHITSISPDVTFMRLTKAIREDFAAAGIVMESDFILHVTLGQVPAEAISIDEVRHRLSSFTIPAFSLNLHTLEYRQFRGNTIGVWKLKTREETVLSYLREHNIAFTSYNHPEGKTIEEAKRWWKDDGSVHCKNIFLRNHKGNQHYLVSFNCDHDLSIHDLEQRLKTRLQAAGKPACGKLSFASAERMAKYLGLEPGSVSPFGLINDTEQHVQLFLDKTLRNAEYLSFHPNDCRGTVVISLRDFERYLETVGNSYEWMELY